MITLVWDALALTGAVLVLVGLWLLHPALCLVCGGSWMLAAGLWGAKTWVASSRDSSRRR